MESLQLLLGGVCPGQHLLRIELEQPLQYLRLVSRTRAVEVDRAVIADG